MHKPVILILTVYKTGAVINVTLKGIVLILYISL